MRFVRVPDQYERPLTYPDGTSCKGTKLDEMGRPTVQRCAACCEGNQVNPLKETRAIARYKASRLP